MMVLALCLVALPAPARAPVVFRGFDSWVVLSRDGSKLDTFTQLGGVQPGQVAASPDGHTLAFTAAKQAGLFYVEAIGQAVKPIPLPEYGFYGDPVFDVRGEWLYFVHHPGGGPVGMHRERAFAQLHRVHLDGSGFEQLTTSDGCKQHPAFDPRGQLVLTHADCSRRTSAIAEFGGADPLVKDEDGLLAEPDVSPDGRRLVLARTASGTLMLFVYTKSTRKLERVLLTETNTTRTNPVWTNKADEVLLGFADRVERFNVRTGQRSTVHSFMQSSGATP